MNPDDLSQLRDIHLPEAVSWWPLATVWWVLLGLLLLLGALGFLLWRRHRAMRWRRVALRELNQLRQLPQLPQDGLADAHSRLCTLSVLLRRVAMARFPRQQVAALHGDAWIALLQGVLGEKKPVPPTLMRLLAVGPYSNPGAVAPDDLTALFAVAEQWINKLPREVAR